MRSFPHRLAEVIKASGLKLHNISKASGVSNTYLARISRGEINKPGKDKIASIMLALNYATDAINQVLAAYDYQPLQKADIPDILANNRRRKLDGGKLPQYDHHLIEMTLVALQRLGGRAIVIKDRPSGIFSPDELYLMREYPMEYESVTVSFGYHLTQALLVERKELFLENCRKGCQLETFICVSCLDDYINRTLSLAAQKANPRRAELVVQYFANAISLSFKMPELHQIHLMERCPYFHFLMQDADGEKPKVSYPGRKLHVFDNQYDRRNLEGFITDQPFLVNEFRQEIEQCRGAVLTEVSDRHPRGFYEYMLERLAKFGLDQELRASVDRLMTTDRVVFF